MAYINPNQPPIIVPEAIVALQTKESRKQARVINKNYYNLGMPKVHHVKKCKKCNRPLFKGHDCNVVRGKILTPRVKCVNPKCEATNVVGAHVCWSCQGWLE